MTVVGWDVSFLTGVRKIDERMSNDNFRKSLSKIEDLSYQIVNIYNLRTLFKYHNFFTEVKDDFVKISIDFDCEDPVIFKRL